MGALDYKPSDIFLTVTDVFVVLLPGAMLVAGVGALLAPEQLAAFSGSATAWIVLAVASYTVGNVVSGLASVVEDELSKKAQTQIEGELGVLRGEVQTEVRRIFSTHLEWINVRRVAGLFVRMQSAPLGAALNRRDADRRFFRNMIAVASLVSILAIARVTYRTHAPLPVAATAAGAGVVLWLLVRTYVSQNEKHTRDTFDYFLILKGLGTFGVSSKASQTQEAGSVMPQSPTTPGPQQTSDGAAPPRN